MSKNLQTRLSTIILGIKRNGQVNPSLLTRIQDSLQATNIDVELFSDRTQIGMYYCVFAQGYHVGTIYPSRYVSNTTTVPEDLRIVAECAKQKIEESYKLHS